MFPFTATESWLASSADAGDSDMITERGMSFSVLLVSILRRLGALGRFFCRTFELGALKLGLGLPLLLLAKLVAKGEGEGGGRVALSRNPVAVGLSGLDARGLRKSLDVG